MQTILANDYRAKRIRFSAVLRGEGIADWAGLWMRVDGEHLPEGRPKVLAFDNMELRPSKERQPGRVTR